MRRPRRVTETLTMDLGDLGERDVDFVCIYTEGTRESGLTGDPRNYDPGEDSDIEIMSAIIQDTDWDILKMIVDISAVQDEICEVFDDVNWYEEDRA